MCLVHFLSSFQYILNFKIKLKYVRSNYINLTTVQVCSWLPSTYPVLPLRFLGTSPDSSSIFPLVISLCRQIASIYDEPLQSIPDELSPLILHFKNLLLCATPEKPLMLFLDSLDQLSGADGAHQLAWLPIALPPHVKVVVSTLPNYYG